MKKIFLLILSLLLLTSCSKVELNPEWYPSGWAGKDTVFVSRPNGKFSIGQYYTNQALAVNTDDGMHDILLSAATDHKRDEDKVYVYSDEGYCVIDETTNTAEVLVTADEQYVTAGTKDPAVTYLKSYDDFSDEAKKVFEKMEEYWSGKNYRRYGSHDKIYYDGTIVYSKLNPVTIYIMLCIALYAVAVAVCLIVFFSGRRKKENKKK